MFGGPVDVVKRSRRGRPLSQPRARGTRATRGRPRQGPKLPTVREKEPPEEVGENLFPTPTSSEMRNDAPSWFDELDAEFGEENESKRKVVRRSLTAILNKSRA